MRTGFFPFFNTGVTMPVLKISGICLSFKMVLKQIVRNFITILGEFFQCSAVSPNSSAAFPECSICMASWIFWLHNSRMLVSCASSYSHREHHYNVIDQTNSFTRFFEDLVIPKDKDYDSEFIELI
jgi:hypothetical protein